MKYILSLLPIFLVQILTKNVHNSRFYDLASKMIKQSELIQINESQQVGGDFSNDIDLNTFSNYNQIVMQHFDLDWTLDLEQQLVKGSVTLHMNVLDEDISRIDLDMWDQEITGVTIKTKSDTQDVSFSVHHFTEQEQGDQGQQLRINIKEISKFQEYIKEDSHILVTIHYSFGSDANAVSFLTKEQTGTKTEPYLYSQCEPIYARSMIPLQDTPIVKATYNADVIANHNLNVYMSANKTDVTIVDQQFKKHSFENSILIPSYLVAIIAGNVEEQKVGDRTYVIAEPDMIDKSAHDLEDLEEYLVTIENYIQIPYIWGTYKIVIMPPSFPFGGMENPLLTFASPSIIVGDKSGTTVAIHEIAHSWTGNMVTCSNWTNLWLNEGFTVFLERKAQADLFGKDFMEMDSIVGNSSFLADVQYFGQDSNFSSLFPLTANRNPDDSFSTVPYEKGYQFLTFLQLLIGEDNMQSLLESWIAANTFKSRVYEDFQEFFNDFIEENVEDYESVQEQVDWKTWIQEPGMGPMDDIEQIHFSTKQQSEALDLAAEWIALRNKKPKNWEELNDFTPNQKYVFLGYLYDHVEDCNPEMLALMQECYDFNNTPNLEIAWRWFEVTIYVGYEDAKEPIYQFLGEIGRQKMVTPQYKAYVATDQRDYAAEVFAHYYDFYHPIARISIEQILAS